MCASWNQEFCRDLVVPELARRRRFGSDGKVLFSPGTEFYELAVTLTSCIRLDPALPEAVKQGLVTSGIFDWARTANLSATNLLKRISRAEVGYLARPFKEYTLVTLMTFRASSLVRRRTLPGASISFLASMPSKYDREEIAVHVEQELRQEAKLTLAAVAEVRVKGRSEAEAAEHAFDALDLLRACWNLYLNAHIHTRMSGPRHPPANQIRLGPVQTLHQEDGRMAGHRYWYNPEFVAPSSVRDFGNRWTAITGLERQVRARLVNNPYRQHLTAALLRYTRALDEGSMENAFLKLWSVLELLTGTLKLPYAKTVRRAAFLFDVPTYHVQVLNHLREHRNKSVHLQQSIEEAEVLVFQLKRYVERLLLFQLFHVRQFRSLDDLHTFLDKPYDTSELDAQLRLLSKARRFRGA